MNKLLTILTIVAVFGIVSVFAFNTEVSAAGGTYCEVGTGVNGVPCVPCTPTPYGGCIPGVSSIIITGDNAEQAEKLTSNNAFILASSVSVIFGMALILNGALLRQKLAGRNHE